MTDRKPLVSIGLPTYNRAASLRRAVESALAQDYPDLELIISDNASADETQAVCAEYVRRDPRVRYIRHDVNLGAVHNFETTLGAARGEFFMWLADDDWIESAYVSRCVAVLIANDDHALVCGTARYYDDERLVTEEPGVSVLDNSAARRVLAYYAQVSGNAAFYGVMRRAHIARIPINTGFGGDWLMIADMAFLGRVGALNEVAINRSIQGVSHDLKKLARSAGLSEFMARSPHLKIAANAWAHITWQSPLYKTLSPPARLLLGGRAFVTICKHCVIPHWYGQVCAYVSKSHPRFNRVAKTVKNRLPALFHS